MSGSTGGARCYVRPPLMYLIAIQYSMIEQYINYDTYISLLVEVLLSLNEEMHLHVHACVYICYPYYVEGINEIHTSNNNK